MAEIEEELESVDESERGEWKSWLKVQHSETQDHGIQSHHFKANRWGNNGNSDRLSFLGLQKSLRIVTAAMKLKDIWFLEENYDQHRQHIEKQRHYFADKGPSSQSYGFSSSHVWMWELHYKESWVPKSWCFWTVVLGEDSWESLGLQGDPTSLS